MKALKLTVATVLIGFVFIMVAGHLIKRNEEKVLLELCSAEVYRVTKAAIHSNSTVDATNAAIAAAPSVRSVCNRLHKEMIP